MNLQGSGLWFADYVSNKCVTDCEVGQGQTCGGLANAISNELYATPLECCQNKIPWLLDSFCEAESLTSSCYGGTGKYYRGDTADVEVCVRDCSTESADPSCGGVVELHHIMLYDTAEDCCTNQYGWIDVELCDIRSTATTLPLMSRTGLTWSMASVLMIPRLPQKTSLWNCMIASQSVVPVESSG